MTFRFATTDEREKWDQFILANGDGGNIFQSKELAEQKKLGGWTPRYIVAGATAITVLEKHVFGLGKLWYASKGPGVATTRQLDGLLPGLRELATRNGVFCIKIEPELVKKDETLADLNASTVLVDISDDNETILARLPQKGRHAIRRAQRDGVVVKQVPPTDENCKIMYDLLAETAAGSFAIRRYHYYKTFWQRFSRAGLGQLFFASFEGQVVAAAYALAFGTKSTYKDGASVRERTAYGASHLLQWHVIQWAKERGALVHDLCGAPPSHEINNPHHPHYGIGRFKTSFNKDVTDYVGAYDLPIQPFAYKVWRRAGEHIVLGLHRRLHHENWY
jgi:lipid II:glycine glycyltransferase (peptidoglycan interpeptide bridge formation enzyme)